MPSWDDFPDAPQQGAGGAPGSWDDFPDAEQRPDRGTESTGDMALDAVSGFGRGANIGIDATLNLIGAPIREPVNYAARQLGYEGDLIPEVEAARRFNVAGTPDTASGRMGQAVGEVAGGSLAPAAGMFGLARRAGQAAPGVLRQFATQPGRAARLEATAAGGAGLGVGAAREAETGPVGELGAGLLGGFAAPGAANIAGRRIAGAQAAKDYASQALRRARDPEASAYENVAGRMEQAGVDMGDLRREMLPQPSGQLASRGLTDEDTTSMVSRALRGESADDIAVDYGVAPDTVRRYLRAYAADNPTPRTVIEGVKEVAGEGRSQPISRLARSSYSIADEASGEAAERLLSRQEEQAGRSAGIVSRSVGDADFEDTLQSGRRALADEARQNYEAFYNEPALAINELGDLAEDPIFRRAARMGMRQARVENIRHNQRVQRTGQGTPRTVMPENAQTDVYTPEQLDYIQRQLRHMAEGHVSDPNRARHARNLREVFLDRIEDHYPSFRPLRRDYATRMGEFGAEGALEAGRQLVPRMGQNTAEALRSFDQMTPAQQELYRIGFAQKLMDDISNPQFGHQVAAKFNTPAFRRIVNRLFSGDRQLRQRGQRLIRDLRREAMTTRTKNEVISGSRTAELQADMEDQMQWAKTAADAGMGRAGQVLENLANRLARQIGKRGAEEVLAILTQTDPAEVLPVLNRLARTATTRREAQMYRDAWRQWKRAGRRPSADVGTVTTTTTERDDR